MLEVILREDIKTLGKAGEMVRVKPGYARNYLLPQGLAYEATEGNKKRIAAESKARERQARGREEARRPRWPNARQRSPSPSRARRARATGSSARSPRSDIADGAGQAGPQDGQAEDRAGPSHQEPGRAHRRCSGCIPRCKPRSGSRSSRSSPHVGIAYVDGPRLARALFAAADWVAAGREEINRINVFPVPDGDTGTNFSLTLRSVADALRALGDASLPETAKAMARGAVLGARGNSGMMLAHFLLGFADSLDQQATRLRAGDRPGHPHRGRPLYASLDDPREGTILTVAREAAVAAERVATESMDIADFMRRLLAEGEEALARTPGADGRAQGSRGGGRRRQGLRADDRRGGPVHRGRPDPPGRPRRHRRFAEPGRDVRGGRRA